MQKTKNQTMVIPAVALVIGVGYLVAGIIGDQLIFGIGGLLVMLVIAGALWFARGHSETVEGLLERGDERINDIELRATAAAGSVVLVATLVAFIVDISRGEDGSPYFWLAALGGVVYIATIVVLRIRR